MRAPEILAVAAVAAFTVAAAACGGSQPASVPPVSSIPFAPWPQAPRLGGGAHTATTSTPPAASTGGTAGAPRALTQAEIAALLAAPDRLDDDKKLDDQRKPDKLLAFLGIGPGMKVGEIGAGGGYTTELLARAVGPSGKVYAQNSPDLLKRFLEAPWTTRLARPVNANVAREDREFDAPFPADLTGLDAVVSVLFYHDTVWIGVDRDKMNKAVFAALRPGGEYVIVDHSAQKGHGIQDVKTFHRIEESVVKDEVTKAGFTLAGSADFLANPQDTRDWNDSPRAAGARRGTSDRFVLKFVKPQ
jgi:predicted methyltransferase